MRSAATHVFDHTHSLKDGPHPLTCLAPSCPELNRLQAELIIFKNYASWLILENSHARHHLNWVVKKSSKVFRNRLLQVGVSEISKSRRSKCTSSGGPGPLGRGRTSQGPEAERDRGAHRLAGSVAGGRCVRWEVGARHTRAVVGHQAA